MYAIIETGGKQFWVAPGDLLRVEKLALKEGSEVTLQALWAAGEPGADAKPKELPTAKVTAEVVRHFRGAKVIVFKKRVKKAYQKTQGHRQDLTEIRIKEISLN
ncbi:MAG: 50S ribosomal protein L21 [Elusimicrobia bacterium]|nr:50S ribosomal protein L21 [Elusimicrobiota bacterium]